LLEGIKMEDRDKNKKKTYQKPSWEKEEMYERFALACGKLPAHQGCSDKRQS
jgi:hypothetical protein